MPRALYIDDNFKEIDRDIERLNRSGKLSVEYLPPPQDLRLTEQFSNASLFFVDWFLDEQGSAQAVSYRGRTLATHLREKMPDKPIILLTKEQFVDHDKARQFIKDLSLFNGYMGKHEVSDDAEKVVKQSLRLIDGFSILSSAPKSQLGFHMILGAEADREGSLLGAAGPPLGGIQDESELSLTEEDVTLEKEEDDAYHWKVASMASWIQGVLLAYPGIIYDALFAATYLGIPQEDFLRHDVQEIFQGAKYVGAFASPQGHWWRGRFIDVAMNFVRQAGLREAPNTGFVRAYEQLKHEKLSLNKCIFSGEQPADWVCYIYKQPVKQEYSLVYHPDARPAIMDDARVSFKAIRESGDVNDQRFDKSSQTLLGEIRDSPPKA